MGRGDGREGSVLAELSFAAAERMLDERGRRQIGMDTDREEAMLDEGEALSRNCARLGAHTLLGRVTRGKGLGPARRRRRLAGIIDRRGVGGNRVR